MASRYTKIIGFCYNLSMTKILRKNISEVSESNIGVYVWITAKGLPAGDQGNVMCIASMRNDPSKIAQLTSAAKYYGVYDGGHAEFREGARPVSEEEYNAQVQRLEAGLDPDPFNPVEAMKYAKQMGYKFK